MAPQVSQNCSRDFAKRKQSDAEFAGNTTHGYYWETINTLLGGRTLDPAGMHCPSWDDAFVSSLVLKFILFLVFISYISNHFYFYIITVLSNISISVHKFCNSFLPRDAMRKRGLCCRLVSIRPSVRLSRWWQISRRLKISSNFFLDPVALSFYFFCLRAPVPNSKGTHFSRGAKYTGWEKFAIFNWNCRLSRKRYYIGPWLL